MRTNPDPPLLAALAAFLSLAAGGAGADEFSEFRIPDHIVHGVSATWSGSVTRFAASSDLTAGSERNHSYFTSAWVDGFRVRDAERGLTSLAWAVRLAGSRYGRRIAEDRSRQHIVPTLRLSASDSDARTSEETVGLDGDWRRYPWGGAVAVEVGVTGQAGFSQSWRRENSRDFLQDSTIRLVYGGTQSLYTRRDSYLAAWSVGVGLGRVRDATGVYSARVLEKRLRDLGVIVRPLTSAGAAKLAALFYVEPDFRSVHDRPNRHFWREVERILREDGVLGDAGLDAFGMQRALEPTAPPGGGYPLGQVRIYRPAGAFVGIAVVGQHAHAFTRARVHGGSFAITDTLPPQTGEWATSDHADDETNLVMLGPRAEFHRPLGLRWQLDAEAHAYWALRNDRVREGIDAGAWAGAAWAVADRWYASAWVTESRSYARPLSRGRPLAGDQWSVGYGARLGWFVEDLLVLELAALETQGSSRESGPLIEEGHRFRRDARLQLGLTYRFAGRLEAPGLFAPQRPVTGGHGP